MFFSRKKKPVEEKKEYALALSKTHKVSEMSPYGVIEALEYVTEEDLDKSDSKFSRILFSPVFTDGFSILWSRTKDEEPQVRNHIPYEVTLSSTSSDLPDRDIPIDVSYGSAMALEGYCDEVQFTGHPLLAGCLSVHVSSVGTCYLSEEEGHYIVPVTVVFNTEEGYSVRVSKDGMEGVLIDDMVEFYTRVGVDSIESLSLDLVEDIVTGMMEFPEEPEVI
jgi:hypothetical protein